MFGALPAKRLLSIKLWTMPGLVPMPLPLALSVCLSVSVSISVRRTACRIVLACRRFMSEVLTHMYVFG